jgi:hypothetical protein
MRPLALLGVLFLALSSGCAATDEVADSASAIVGGAAEADGSAIAQRTVLFTPRSVHGLHGCTATILDGAHALTAAHCLFGAKGVPDLVLVFATRFADDAPMRPVTAMRAFNDGFDDDVAVVTFSGGLPPGYVPVTLTADVPLAARQSVVHAGYGQTSADSDGSDRGVLRSVTGLLQSVDEASHRLLFSSPGHTTCNGDSGGPDFVTRAGDGALVQVGIHSTGSCQDGSSSMDVRSYLPWIQAQLSPSR